MVPLARYSAVLSAIALLTTAATSVRAADEFCAGVPGLKSNTALQPSLSVVKQPKAGFVKGGDTKGCPAANPECAGRRFVWKATWSWWSARPGTMPAPSSPAPAAKSITSFGFLPKSALGPGPAATAPRPPTGSAFGMPAQSRALTSSQLPKVKSVSKARRHGEPPIRNAPSAAASTRASSRRSWP